MPERVPAVEVEVVAARRARDTEHVDVARLAELLVHPHDHGHVALEVAESPSAGFWLRTRIRIVQPGPLARPRGAIAPAEVLADAALRAQGVVRLQQRRRARVERE